MATKQWITAVCAFLLLTTAGCGKAFKNAESLVDAQNENGNGQVSEPTKEPDIANEWAKVSQSVDGQVDGSVFDGQLLIQIDSVNQALIIYLPIPFASLITLPINSIDIPQLPGMTLFQVTQPDGSVRLAVRVPLEYIIKGAQLTPYNMLPNGDPLPFMPAGENRGFALALPQNPDMRLHFYFTANAAAVFIELPQVNLPEPWNSLSVGFPIRNISKTQVVGYFAFIPNRATFPSGVYVASRLPTQIAVAIDNLLRY